MIREQKRSWAYETLPQCYDLYEIVNLAENKKIIKVMVISSLIIGIAMIILGAIYHPFKVSFQMPPLKIIFSLLAMVIGMIVYVFLHEGVHGFFIKMFTGERPYYGFKLDKGMFYAGSNWLFQKVPYIVIAISPIVVWGIVLALLLNDVQDKYWWYLYAIQILNITGAAGDIYITWRVLRMPKDLLVLDMGTSMKFFAPVKKAEAGTEENNE